MLWYAVFIIAFAYQCAMLAAVVRFLTRPRRHGGFAPGISVLKPVRGLDEALEAALRSHFEQDYPEYEVLVGVGSLDDPAVPVVRRLIEAHPGVACRLLVCGTQAPNAKAGKLVDLERAARYPVLLVNDSDITVPPDYLRRVVAPLADERAGLVTCPYRANAGSAAGQWEALGIATDFVPSTLVAPMVGVKEFGLGSTLCFRREDLRAAGGFEAVADYIADDYQLSRRITGLGKHAVMSEVVVETHLNSPSWRQVWTHQVRWARTIRVSRLDGFLGLPVTHAGLWALVLLLAGQWVLAAALAGLRVLAGVAGGFLALRHRPALRLAALIPLWDVFAFAIWVTALTGNRVRWRAGALRLSGDGRITEITRD